jgi:PmbA protein
MAVVPGNPSHLAEKDLESIIERALEEARIRGASQAEAAVSQDTGLSVGVRLGEVETLEHQRDRSMGITVYFGQRKGSASTADFSLDAVRATVAKACSIARFTAEDACAGLADASLMERSPPDLDLAHPWNVSADRAIEIAKLCEAAAMGFDPRINNSEGSSVSTHRGLHVYGNTHGFVGGYPTTSHTLSCVVLAGSGEDMQRDYWYSSSRDWRDLQDPEVIGRESARRTIARLEPRKLSTRRAPVLFNPEMARGFIGHFTGAIRGSSQYRQSSFLLNSIGQQVFPAGFSISERPHILKAMGSAPFDEEGVATRERELIADGVLTGYILSSYSARKLGLKTTGNAGGAHNLVVAANTAGGLEALLSRLGSGLYVTELMGQGVNAVTGDYSRGAAGFWVENGVIQYPVAEITIAGNLRDMFKHIAAVGDDVDTRGGTRVGSVLLEEMTIAGD